MVTHNDQVELFTGPASVSVSELTAYAGQQTPDPYEAALFDGGKFYGGFGPTQVHAVDYWTLRARSAQLFTENLYARGLVRRLITNEIGPGVWPEVTPDEQILGMTEESLADWCEITENRFGLWGKTPGVCDFSRRQTLAALQRTARMEAIVEGDVLVVLRQHPVARVPSIQLVRGGKIQTPYLGEYTVRAGNTVRHGVEFDAQGREVAYWVRQEDLSFKRLPAYGEKSGRRLAWLLYGTEKRLDDVRGQPLLSIVLQSLKEIDRYRDSVQRKAVVNSILAMFVTKSADKTGTLPLQGGAVRRDSAAVSDSTTGDTPRRFNVAQHIPGLVIEELQVGEDIETRGGEGTDINFAAFEDAIISAFAWSCEMPPEILRLAFTNNYSASAAAINEFKMYLNRFWSQFGEEFCAPIYEDWLISEALLGKNAQPGVLDSWRDPQQFDAFAAWVNTEWYGSIKPSTDTVKQGRGAKMMVTEGWSTNAREARALTGTKFSKNIKRLVRENEQKAAAMRPLLEVISELQAAGVSVGAEQTAAMRDAVVEALDDWRDHG